MINLRSFKQLLYAHYERPFGPEASSSAARKVERIMHPIDTVPYVEYPE
jgi:hypothetical protein